MKEKREEEKMVAPTVIAFMKAYEEAFGEMLSVDAAKMLLVRLEEFYLAVSEVPPESGSTAPSSGPQRDS